MKCFVTLLSLMVACESAGTTPAASTPTKAKAATPTSAKPTVAEPDYSRIAANEQMVAVGAIAALSSQVFIPYAGYPGHGFRIGVVDSDAVWAKLSTSGLATPDFQKDLVVAVIFDAQTNSLSAPVLTRTDRTLKVDFQWRGIEPFYPGITPAILATVPRDGFNKVQVRANSGDEFMHTLRLDHGQLLPDVGVSSGHCTGNFDRDRTGACLQIKP